MLYKIWGYYIFDLNIKMPENEKLQLSSDETTTLFKMMALYFIKDAAIKLPITLTKQIIKSCHMLEK